MLGECWKRPGWQESLMLMGVNTRRDQAVIVFHRSSEVKHAGAAVGLSF